MSLTRTMRPAEYVLVGLSVIATLVCLRLGVWQVSRLHERRASNAMVAGRLAEAPVTLDQLPRDTGSIRFRRVHVAGTYDYAHEIVLTNRTRDGSPGVNILTPLRIAGRDTAVLVNRGWVYAPDGVRNDISPWHEGDSADIVAYAEPPQIRGTGVARSPSRANGYRWYDLATLKTAIPYPVLPLILVLDDTAASDTHPPRIPLPPLDEGPHMSYAIQWFSFAVIAFVGMIFFIRRTRTLERRSA